MGDGEITLRLKYEPTPENAPRLAELVIAPARDVSGAKLDFSPGSLKEIDRIVEEMRADDVPLEQISETLFSFGCYLGEVIVRHTTGEWRPTAGSQMEAIAGWPIVVAFAEDELCNPIGKVFKLFDNGIEDSVAYFYSVFAKKHEVQRRGFFTRVFGGPSN